MQDRKQLLKLDISIFEKNGKSEFAQLVKKNKLRTTRALNDFLIGMKNEAADTKEASRIILKFISQQQISKDEEQHLKTQVSNVFKMVGIGIPFVLIPGATLLIPVILKAAEKKGIDLCPSNFKKNRIKDSKG
ncbi:LETM1 domain-containing protein [uncultured Lutibacter sp.]|uniref:LETM1 domain-containing protein n=1 Tax=uncultured Lutibacter sp. TaxID=437739 RepID=UPI002602EBF6|nr:LETM1 domain-containing protein [uncultured Lutibacter sp.]